MGRKRKYEERVIPASFGIPIGLNERIAELAYKNKVSKSEYIVNALMSHDPDLTQKLISNMKELKERITNLEKANIKLTSEMKQAKKLGTSYFLQLPETPIEARPLIKKELPRIKARVNDAYDENQKNNILKEEAKWLAGSISVELAKKGMRPKNQGILEQMIIKELAKVI